MKLAEKNTIYISTVWYYCLDANMPAILAVIGFALSVPMTIHFVVFLL